MRGTAVVMVGSLPPPILAAKIEMLTVSEIEKVRKPVDILLIALTDTVIFDTSLKYANPTIAAGVPPFLAIVAVYARGVLAEIAKVMLPNNPHTLSVKTKSVPNTMD
jgi:hypothetical protein